MDPYLIVLMLSGVAVALLIGGMGMLLTSPVKSKAERRLEEMANRRAKGAMGQGPQSLNLLRRPDAGKKFRWVELLPSVEKLNLLFEQAHVNISFNRFLLIMLGLALVPVASYLVLGTVGLDMLPIYSVPIASAVLASVPVFWLMIRRRARINKFVTQMPDALELTARALRAGHGLGSGLSMVAQEMTGPIAEEFGRVFDEQNYGIAMEEALRSMAERIPVMDVRFFVTAVVIQRATGGDLGEVLDKIGRLVRQRFEIKGQVAALTGEGRLSGMVLLAMPPGLLAYLFMTNRDYVMLLFTDPFGRKMLIIAAVMQVLGALAIKKIVNIKV